MYVCKHKISDNCCVFPAWSVNWDKCVPQCWHINFLQPKRVCALVFSVSSPWVTSRNSNTNLDFDGCVWWRERGWTAALGSGGLVRPAVGPRRHVQMSRLCCLLDYGNCSIWRFQSWPLGSPNCSPHLQAELNWPLALLRRIFWFVFAIEALLCYIFTCFFSPCVILLLVYFILLEGESPFFESPPLPNVLLPISSPDCFLQEIPSLKLLLILFYFILLFYYFILSYFILYNAFSVSTLLQSIPGKILPFI